MMDEETLADLLAHAVRRSLDEIEALVQEHMDLLDSGSMDLEEVLNLFGSKTLTFMMVATIKEYVDRRQKGEI